MNFSMVKANHRSFFVNEECIICNRKIDGKKSSNLRRHLERFHPKELAAFDKSVPPVRVKKGETPIDKHTKLQNELINFFISSGISLEHLHNNHLRELLNAIPNFSIPTLEDVQIQMAITLIPSAQDNGGITCEVQEKGNITAEIQVDSMMQNPIINQ